MQTEHNDGTNAANVIEITIYLRLFTQTEHKNGGNTANVTEITTYLRLSMQTERKNGTNTVNFTEITTYPRLSVQTGHGIGTNTANVTETTIYLRLPMQMECKNGTNTVFSSTVSNAPSYFFYKIEIHFSHPLPMADPSTPTTAHLLSLPAEIRLKIVFTAATYSSADTQTLRSFLLLCRDFHTLLIANFSIIVEHYTVKEELFDRIRYIFCGQCHRDNDLPAATYANRMQQWWQRGKRHRDNDLPAIIFAHGTQQWWQHGTFIRHQ